MRTSGSVVFSFLLILLSTFSTAWPLWPRWLPELDSLVVRQNDDNASSTQVASQTSAPQSSGSRSAASSITTPPSTNTQSSGRQTTSAPNSQTGSQRVTSSAASKTTNFDPRLPAGGVAMITPSVFDGEQYFKIGDKITFAWNYTSLLATPTAVNIMATCKANNQLYTLAMNQTIQANATQSLVWDSGSYQQTALADPLLTEKYTLIIYDAASAITANAKAGYLASFNQYSFGMYEKQRYVPKEEYVCVTCSGALGDMEKRAMGMMFGMCAITVMSFSWFVGGTGIIW